MKTFFIFICAKRVQLNFSTCISIPTQVDNDAETASTDQNMKTTDEGDLPPKYEDVAETPPKYDEATMKCNEQ